MKKRIKNVLNTMGSGLKHSHVGEMLTNEQKTKVLKSSSAGEMPVKKEEINASVHHA